MAYHPEKEYKRTFDKRSSEQFKDIPVNISKPDSFEKVKLMRDGLIYDPYYILKFKGPSLHQMIDRINELAIAVTDLQVAVTNLVEVESKEERKVIDNVWNHVKQCCSKIGISYSPSGKLWDGSGIVEEGINAYRCHIKVKSDAEE